MRIYLDLVLILNFLVDFLLLLGTDRLTGHATGPWRCLAAAALGSAYSGVCLVPGFGFLGSTFWRMVFLCLMAGISFGWTAAALRRTAIFILLSMALGGIAAGLGGGGFGMLMAAALGVWLLCRVGFGTGGGQAAYIPVELTQNGKTVRMTALRDTGNLLRDPLTGEQVLVAGADVAEELLGLTGEQLRDPVETVASGIIPGMRLLPYRAVGQPGGMLLTLRFRHAKIGNTYADPLVAFAPEALTSGGRYRMLTGGAV